MRKTLSAFLIRDRQIRRTRLVAASSLACINSCYNSRLGCVRNAGGSEGALEARRVRVQSVTESESGRTKTERDSDQERASPE
ncbi:hypothetical protein LSTR_LSTR003714 [Laodelphax striatellus]|uniref:Uncharacterized protein n=1 Tax=Laodelphax striatellus TaxID=195883 RepID=A0A482X1B3_LAOST|nr:hypothetical protein LSTR_LSTR003714 [Laodelphax striatellus]